MSKVYHSWEIINDHEVVKNCDKSFFDDFGSTIPEELDIFFEVDKLTYSEKKRIKLYFKGMEFDARLLKDSLKVVENNNLKRARSRILWKSDLSKRFKKYKDQGSCQCSFIKNNEKEYTIKMSKVKNQKRPRNPNWSRDEVILGLDTYFRIVESGGKVTPNNKDIIELSNYLRSLKDFKHASYRNCDGVSRQVLKLGSLFFKPNGKEVKHVSKIFREVTSKYTQPEIRRMANEIRMNTSLQRKKVSVDDISELLEEYKDNLNLSQAKSISASEVKKLDARPVVYNKDKKNHRVKTKPSLAKYVMEQGGFRCACCSDHVSFLKVDNTPYMEAHHLIPLSFQEEIGDVYNLDRSKNIVCLCPNCHRALHYGSYKEIRDRLIPLYENFVLKDKMNKLFDISGFDDFMMRFYIK